MVKDIPDSLPIYFLGICDKYSTPAIAHATDGHVIARQDIIGLRTVHTQSVYPVNANDFFAVFVIDAHFSNLLSEKQITVKHEDGTDVGYFKVNATTFGGGNKLATRYAIFSVKVPGVLKSPGLYSIFLKATGLVVL